MWSVALTGVPQGGAHQSGARPGLKIHFSRGAGIWNQSKQSKGWLPLSRNFYSRTCVKFTFANKIEAMYERSQLCVKVESRSTSRSIWTLYILPLFYLRDHESFLALTCAAKNASVEINFNTVNEISKVRTRELCLCLAPFVFVASVVLTSLIYVMGECNRILYRGWASVNSLKKLDLW